MSRVSQCLHLAAALILLAAAGAIVLAAGLPQRAASSGIRRADGSYIAPEYRALAPPFTLSALDGSALSLAAVDEPLLILTFWATWCPPCKQELRDLQALYERQRGQLRVLAINLGESADAVRHWADALGLTYDILLDRAATVAMRYHIRGGPTTFLLDAQRRIQQLYIGAADIQAIERAVIGALAPA